MRRYLIFAVAALVVLLVVTAGTLAYILNDQPLLKSQLASLVQHHTGRTLQIAGPLNLDLGRVTTLNAGQITLSDADWADSPYMARIGRLEVSLDISSLFGDRPIRIPHLKIEECAINLLENDQGQANWELFPDRAEETPAPAEKSQLLPVRFTHLLVSQCQLKLDTPSRLKPLAIEGSRIALEQPSGQRVRIDAHGRVNTDPVSIEGWLDPANAFLVGGRVDHELNIDYGAVSLHSAGTVADAKSFTSVDVAMRFSGPAIENVLDVFSLPHFSTGDFDFRLGIGSENDMNRIEVDGDLGSIDLVVDGEIDRLLRPTAGELRGALSGPDLQKLGLALGIEGLPASPYSFKSHTRYESEAIHLRDSILDVGADQLEISGRMSVQAGMPNTTLDISLLSQEIGRWIPLTGNPAMQLGPLNLKGTTSIDKDGQTRIDATAGFAGAQITAAGPIGRLEGPLTPHLKVGITTENARPLLALAGRPAFPEVPARMDSHLKLEGKRLDISGLELELPGQKATVNGHVNLEERISGSDLDVSLDIENLEEFGKLFGKPNLPPQPLSVRGELKPQGRGLVFRVDDSRFGDIRLKIDGRIADLDKPLGMDANFDVRLPGLDILSAVLPDVALPPGAFEATGALHNENRFTALKDVNMTLGEIKASVSGQLMHDRNFDLQLEASGPDVSAFGAAINEFTGAAPFSLKTGLVGNPGVFTLSGLNVRVGESDLAGDLEIRPGERTGISGKLASRYLDLRTWKTAESGGMTAREPGTSPYVFDDSPVLTIDDYGLDVDAELRVDKFDLGNTQLEGIDIAVQLEKGVLDLSRFKLTGKGGGQFSGRALLDARHDVPMLDLEFIAIGLRAGIGSGVGQDISTWPAGDFDIKLRGSGRTNREMASSLNGTVRVSYGSGLMAIAGLEFLMSDFLTELLTTLNPFSTTSEHTELECLVAAAEVTDGQVAVQPVVFRTRQITIFSEGEIDLRTEKIDLSFNSVPRKGLGLSASTLINPFIKVGGRLKSPVVELDPANTVVRGGIAVATAGLSILAKSMGDRFLSSKDPCGDALRTIEASAQE